MITGKMFERARQIARVGVAAGSILLGANVPGINAQESVRKDLSDAEISEIVAKRQVEFQKFQIEVEKRMIEVLNNPPKNSVEIFEPKPKKELDPERETLKKILEPQIIDFLEKIAIPKMFLIGKFKIELETIKAGIPTSLDKVEILPEDLGIKKFPDYVVGNNFLIRVARGIEKKRGDDTISILFTFGVDPRQVLTSSTDFSDTINPMVDLDETGYRIKEGSKIIP